MLVQLGFESGFFNASLGVIRQLDGDLFVLRASKYRFGDEDAFARRDLDPAAGVTGVASVVPLYASWQSLFWKEPGGDKSYLVQAFAFDPDRQVFLLPEVNELRTLLKQEDAVLVDRRARPFLGMGGDARETEINGRAVHLVGRSGLGPDHMSNGTLMKSGPSPKRPTMCTARPLISVSRASPPMPRNGRARRSTSTASSCFKRVRSSLTSGSRNTCRSGSKAKACTR